MIIQVRTIWLENPKKREYWRNFHPVTVLDLERMLTQCHADTGLFRLSKFDPL